MGFVVSALGIGGIIASTCMDQWSTQDLYNNPVTAVFNYQGLWRTCVRESSGFTECRGYFTILGLPESWFHLALQIKARCLLLDFPAHLEMLMLFDCSTIALGF
ncbi:hypothetical protein DUI87_21417 [Hirundo rustica rustica]|uniref:Claudin n=1 Tax=Hirundo rustica rustica TaxID=333673 RepID=A0A3M0JU31_HIRRU|nr:hypothetical protein DUI87_21417 [Hirundo rustica rustica]